MTNYDYPPQPVDPNIRLGVVPVDFALETVLLAGLKWFRETPEAPRLVYGYLAVPWLSAKYGEAKIAEIGAFIRKYEIRVVQHWSLIDDQKPSISIQLMNADETISRTGLSDYAQNLDIIDAEMNVLSRNEISYSPITDSIQIGIHAIGTPDLTKYLYYFVIYILNAFKPQLEEREMHLSTFTATDISRINEFLPENVYSRFINFSVYSHALFDKGKVPILEEIIGVHIPQGVDVGPSDELVLDTGLSLINTIGGSNG